MKLYVKSKERAEASNDLEEPHVIISINFPQDAGSRSAKPVTNEHTKEVLHLFFSDVGRYGNPVPPEKELVLMDYCTPFNNELAKKVIDLLDRAKVKHVIIHCLMGGSRSPSLANAISIYYNGRRVTEFKSINYLVESVMLDELTKHNKPSKSTMLIDKILQHGGEITLPYKQKLEDWYQGSYGLYYSRGKYVVSSPESRFGDEFDNLEDAINAYVAFCEEIGPIQQYIQKDFNQADDIPLDTEEGINEMRKLIDQELKFRR